jgi:hypothetical protein
MKAEITCNGCTAAGGRHDEGLDRSFATVVLAHLATQATRHDPQARLGRKLSSPAGFYERGLPRQTIIDLYRFLDWLMRLPEDLELQFTETIHRIEEQLKYALPQLRGAPRRAPRRWHHRLLRGQLEQRFAPLPPEIIERLEQADADQLMRWGERFSFARTLDDIFEATDEPPAAESGQSHH